MTPKEYFQKKTFCVLPWTGVYVQPDGQVRNCAITNETLGNINDQSLEAILKGEINQAIKRDMLDDVEHPRCGHCHMLEQNQQPSMDQVSNRIWYLKTMASKDLSVFDRVDNFQLKMIDLRWKNTCNHACIYCGPDLSSLWASELGLPSRIDDDAMEQSLGYIYQNLHTINHVYLAGGEPLLIKENMRLLKTLLEQRPDIDIRINSNLSVINNEIYNLLKQFQKVHWTVSVDGVGKEFEYVRYGGSWPTFVENLNQLKQDFEKINFNSTWCILTATGTLDCIEFLQTMGFHENTFIVNPLDNPKIWHVGNLPRVMLDLLETRLMAKIGTADPKYALYNSLNLMLKFLKMSFSENLQKTFIELAEIDRRRGTDSSLVFPELYKFYERP